MRNEEKKRQEAFLLDTDQWFLSTNIDIDY